MEMNDCGALETKFQSFGNGLGLEGEAEIAGYASLFGVPDQGGDVVKRGAYEKSLAALSGSGRSVKMLWQHDPGSPIGVWDEVREDGHGLLVRGRLLTEVRRGAEALSLIRAGAIDGLSIGYRTIRAMRTDAGRALQEIDLWEVSLVTFPMLPQARASARSDEDVTLARDLAQALSEARDDLA